VHVHDTACSVALRNGIMGMQNGRAGLVKATVKRLVGVFAWISARLGVEAPSQEWHQLSTSSTGT
jgi:hypothetical protein